MCVQALSLHCMFVIFFLMLCNKYLPYIPWGYLLKFDTPNHQAIPLGYLLHWTYQTITQYHGDIGSIGKNQTITLYHGVICSIGHSKPSHYAMGILDQLGILNHHAIPYEYLLNWTYQTITP